MHPAKFYLTFVLLPQLLIAPFLALRPPNPTWAWSNYAFFTCIILVSLFAVSNPSLKSEGDPNIDSLLGSAVGGSLFNALHILLLVNPMKQYRHKSDDGMNGPMELPWWKRIYWAGCATFSMRGIGWNFQVPYITIQRHKSRTTFILFALSRILSFFLLADVVQYLTYLTDKADGPENIISNLFDDPHTTFYYLVNRIGNTVAWGLENYASLSQLYYTVAILSVTFHISSPEDWPPLFGSWTEAYCLRNFWGKTWHQMVRRFCISPGKLISQKLNLQSGSLSNAFIQIYIAFLVSAIVHSFGDFRTNDRLGKSFLFFTLQPIAITLEEVVQMQWRTSRYNGNGHEAATWSLGWRTVGYAWVLVWFIITAPLHNTEDQRTRSSNNSSFSLIHWLVENITVARTKNYLVS
ncbi:hypothetical protein GYMLUDRAFT_229841 [Collybiopsis luxurians FD-317 M1]|uniref:Unplaced genomic scaffold GYMLUscaffold_46, whole genome shotgun sequence n=1 Tax=Collybiopsis luxurians FD-317 M1 TaxID=944289 RepID=A0A0D0CFG4_9AGAR|nr:hypothetical protein GYMLUDRAFT_229841 [Collybiopsis luxurians FD-317 M1]